MTNDEANMLIRKMQAHWATRWSNDLTAYWMDILLPLHTTAANTTFLRLQRTKHLAPGDFVEKYESLHTVDAGNRPPLCAVCSGTGMVTDTNHPAHWPGDSKTVPQSGDGVCACNVSTFCRQCEQGAKARELLTRMNTRAERFAA